ncbi:MAG: hypothetical protein V1798_06215 [Pseudomonadota bacterium]
MTKGILAALVVTALCAPPQARAAVDATALANDLDGFFGIYLLKKERRSPQERVLVRGSEQKGFAAEISYWRGLQSRDPDEEVCNAYKWLLFGRGAYGKGAVDAFVQYPALIEIELKFFDIEGGTKLGQKKGEVLPTSRVIPYLKIAVERHQLLGKKVDWKRLKEQTNEANCPDLGARYLSSKWFDEAYLKQGKKGE